jgi:GDPmannose 4,6-dehydratase
MYNGSPTALISGATGQDGSFLAEILLRKGYYVVGLKRRSSTWNTSKVDHLYHDCNFKLEYYDSGDVGVLYKLLLKYQPEEFYSLMAQSHVRVSFDLPEFTVETLVMGTLRLFEAVRTVSPHTKIYVASSSEMFGDNPNLPYNEESTLMPCSPYGCAKVFCHNLSRNYRKSYGMFISSGILHNHTSFRRGETFVTRKITLGAARIFHRLEEKLVLGNLDAKRDIGYARDFMTAAWLMLQQEKPDDFVIATGKSYSIREFAEKVFSYMGLGDSQKYIEIDPKYYRPHEVPYLLGDASKAKRILGWEPETDIDKLVQIMCDHDLELIDREKEIGIAKWHTQKINKEIL